MINSAYRIQPKPKTDDRNSYKKQQGYNTASTVEPFIPPAVRLTAQTAQSKSYTLH